MKPSFFLALFTLLFGAFLVIARPAGPQTTERAPRQPVVVQNPSPDNRAPQRVELRGTVQDRFGWPVSGAMVRAFTTAGGVGVAETVSDNDGLFALGLSDSVPVDLRVTAPGHGVEWARRFPAQRNAGCITLGPALPWESESLDVSDLPAWEGGRLAGEGFVKDADGRLAPGVLVVVEETGLSARSNANGQFRLGLPTAGCTLRARSPDGHVATLVLDAPSRSEGLTSLPDLRLSPGLRLEGMVSRPDGAVAADVPVRVRGAGMDHWTQTDGAGSFEVLGLVAAEYTITAHAREGALGVRTTVVMDGQMSLQQFRLLAETPLTVRVLRPTPDAPEAAPLPVAGAHVFCSEADGLRWSHSQADDEGVVRMRGLAEAPRQFEVRENETWVPLAVVDFDEAAGHLLVR